MRTIFSQPILAGNSSVTSSSRTHTDEISRTSNTSSEKRPSWNRNLTCITARSVGPSAQRANQSASLKSENISSPCLSVIGAVKNIRSANDIKATSSLHSAPTSPSQELLKQRQEAFHIKWNGIAQTNPLSPRTDVGIEIIDEFITAFVEPFGTRSEIKQFEQFEAFQKDVLTRTLSYQYQTKFVSLTSIYMGNIAFASRAEHSENMWLRQLKVPAKNAYKLVMDQKFQHFGPFYFEDECRYMSSMLCAFIRMIDTLHDPLSARLLEDLHTAAATNSHARNSLKLSIAPGFRSCRLTVQLAECNCSKAGLVEFFNKSQARNGWATVEEVNGRRTLVLSPQSKEACRSKADEVIDRYHHEVGLAPESGVEREDAILTAIAKCGQDLDQHHLFSDGNIRTIAFLCMNKLLLQNDLSPVLWHDPNILDMFSVSEIVGAMREGQAAYQQLLT